MNGANYLNEDIYFHIPDCINYMSIFVFSI